MSKSKVIIMGAAGRDFHNFNVVFRDQENYEVIAFTAAQIPGIDDKKYPASLAGRLYPDGIPIYPESQLTELIKKYNADKVVFSYSDIRYIHLMSKASEVLAAGADFWLLGPDSTMIKSKVPVISVCATRTGCGKSQTTRRIIKILRQLDKKVVSIRHPMPYGDLAAQACQRFAAYADLDRHQCTIEEREEYEPHIDLGAIIYAGVDYEQILREAEKEADVILWDGGNNDFSFYKPDLNIVVADPLRAGDELKYHPGETNLRMADIVIINKIDSASREQINNLRKNIKSVNPRAVIIDAASPVTVDNPEVIRDKKVLIIEDGPTLTHGEMNYGAGLVAAKKFGVKEIISPHPYAVGSIKTTYEKYKQTRDVLPAMGYGKAQIQELEQTINRVPAEAVIIGTPIDLRKILKISLPAARVSYDLQEIGRPALNDIINKQWFDSLKK